MPIYEYRCTACGSQFEYMQRMSDEAKTTCETCSGTLERLISAAAFHLKGGGWYKDLYSSAKPAAGASEGGAGKDAGGSADKADKKDGGGAADKPVKKDSGGSSDGKGGGSSSSSGGGA
jgi:putative FmdB family regulatory protein